MKNNGYWLVVMWITLIFLLIIFYQIPEGASAAPHYCISTIGLDQPTQTADVSPGSLGTVEFSGTVSVSMNGATTAIVTIIAEDTWGTAKVEPPALQFSNTDSGSKVFRVSVKVPTHTSTSDHGQVRIFGRMVKYPSGEIGTVQPRDGVVGRIDIEPYYDFETYYPSKYPLGWYGSHFV
jgi:hypothetical protein